MSRYPKKVEIETSVMMKFLEEQKIVANPSKVAFGSYLEYWLENYVKINLTKKTYTEYKKLATKQIIPFLGSIELCDLTHIHLQDCYDEKLKMLSEQSVLHHHRLISKALNDAIEWGFIETNVARMAKAPKPAKAKMRTLDATQMNLLLKVAKDKAGIYYPAIYAAAHLGLMRSEILGVRWEDIDLKNNVIYIRQTITEANGEYFVNPKTINKKLREIKFTKGMKALLEIMKLKHDKIKALLGASYNPLDLIFCGSGGNILSPAELHRVYKRILKEAELPEIRFHELRHSHAAILLKSNVHPKIVSERMGHSRIDTTIDTYSHVISDIEDNAVDTFNQLFEVR